MTPAELVVEASVLVAAGLAAEPNHSEAFVFLRTCARQEVARLAPAIIAAEVKGPVTRRTGQPALARQLFAALRARPDFVVLPIDAAVGDEAGEIASLQGIKGCDSVYVAIARLLTIPLVTLDREQQDRAPADVEVYTPAQALVKWWPS